MKGDTVVLAPKKGRAALKELLVLKEDDDEISMDIDTQSSDEVISVKRKREATISTAANVKKLRIAEEVKPAPRTRSKPALKKVEFDDDVDVVRHMEPRYRKKALESESEGADDVSEELVEQAQIVEKAPGKGVRGAQLSASLTTKTSYAKESIVQAKEPEIKKRIHPVLPRIDTSRKTVEAVMESSSVPISAPLSFTAYIPPPLKHRPVPIAQPFQQRFSAASINPPKFQAPSPLSDRSLSGSFEDLSMIDMISKRLGEVLFIIYDRLSKATPKKLLNRSKPQPKLSTLQI
jgi:hypothetical protein